MFGLRTAERTEWDSTELCMAVIIYFQAVSESFDDCGDCLGVCDDSP